MGTVRSRRSSQVANRKQTILLRTNWLRAERFFRFISSKLIAAKFGGLSNTRDCTLPVNKNTRAAMYFTTPTRRLRQQQLNRSLPRTPSTYIHMCVCVYYINAAASALERERKLQSAEVVAKIRAPDSRSLSLRSRS